MSTILRRELGMRIKRRMLPPTGDFWFQVGDYRMALDWPSGISKSLYYNQIYHPQTVQWLRRNLGRNDICVDVGAHVGYISIIMAERAAVVHAFEPNPHSRRLLNLNLTKNTLQNVYVYPQAVSDHNSNRRFFLNRDSGHAGLVAHDGISDRIDVDVVTLDSMIDYATLVKIDVEGTESKVLLGMRRLLKNPGLRLIVEIQPDRPGFTEEVFDILDGWHFQNLDWINVLCWRDHL